MKISPAILINKKCHSYRGFLASKCEYTVLCLVTQSCPTLRDPVDCHPSGSSLHGVLQARNWSGLPCPPPGDLPNPGIEPRYPALQVDSLPSEPPGKPWYASIYDKRLCVCVCVCVCVCEGQIMYSKIL